MRTSLFISPHEVASAHGGGKMNKQVHPRDQPNYWWSMQYIADLMREYLFGNNLASILKEWNCNRISLCRLTTLHSREYRDTQLQYPHIGGRAWIEIRRRR